MKLQAAIKPRRDGVINVVGADGKPYVFLADDAGELVCDIAHEDTLRMLTRTGNFFAADDLDEQAVMDLAGAKTFSPNDDDDMDPDNPDGDDEVDMAALPVEGHTLPKPHKANKPKAK
jgi:hypothetical protein